MAQVVLTIGGESKKSKWAKREVSVDWDKLPAASQDFVKRYGLKQYIADGMAGATTQAEANEGIDDRLRKLKEADFKRSVGDRGPTNDPNVLARQMAMTVVKDTFKEKNIALPEKSKLQSIADAYFTKNEKDLVKEATRQIENRKKLAQAAAEAAGDDIMAALGLDPEAGKDDEPDEAEDGEDGE